MTSLRGNLSTVDLANILQMLQMNQREGTLYITGAEGRRAIYFGLDGVSTLSRGGRRHGALGRILVRQGVISDAQLQDAVRRQNEGSARMIGQVLVEQGLAKREQVEESLRVQIEEEIYDLFITKDAQFEFVEGDVPTEFADPDGVNRIAVNVNSVIMEAAQRIDEWEWIQAVVPDFGEIYRYTGLNVPLDDEIFHERATGRVLTAIDGRKSIEDLIETSYVERFDVCKVIALLLQGNALEPVPPAALHDEAEKAIAAGDTAATIKFLVRLTQLHAETPDTHRRLAEAYESESELERAAFHYRVFAETRIDSDDTVEAFRVYRRVFAILPTDLAAADRMVEIYSQNSNGLEEFGSEVIQTGRMLAEVYVDLERNSRAIQTLHRVVSLAPDDADIRTRLIDVYLAAGMAGEAVAEYEILAESALALEEFTRAERIYRKILTIDSGRNDILRRLNQLISRKTRRRRSVRNSFAAAGIVTLLGVAGWYGIKMLMEQRAADERAEATAIGLVADFRDDHASLANDLDSMLTRITVAAAAADDTALLNSLQQNGEELDRLDREVNEALRGLMSIVQAHAGSTAADEARALADSYTTQIKALQRSQKDARGRLADSAQAVYIEARKLADNQAAAEVQWAKFDEARSLGLVSAEWTASDDGKECLAFHDSLREIIESLSTTREAVEQLLQDGYDDAAFDRAIAFLHDYPPPDLADKLEVPIRIVSEPAGAAIALNGQDTGQRTPATLLLRVRKGGELRLTAQHFDPTPIVFEAITDVDPKVAQQRIPRALSARLQRMNRFPPARLSAPLEAAPTVVGDLVIVPTRGAETAVLNVETGAPSKGLELRNPSGAIAQAIVVNGIAATLTVDGRIYFHRLDDRKLLGAYEAPGELRSDPIAVGSLLIVGTSSGRLIGVDVDTRAERWRYPSSTDGGLPPALVGAPVVAGGELFSARRDGTITVLDPTTGAVLRQFELRDPNGAVVLARGIAVQGSALLAVTPRGHLMNVNTRTGDRIWMTPMEVQPAGPPLTNGTRVVVVGENGRVVSVRLDNAEAVGHLDTGARSVAASTMEGDALYVPLEGGRLLAVDVGPSAVRRIWEHIVPADVDDCVEITTRPLLHGGTVLFGTADNSLRAVVR